MTRIRVVALALLRDGALGEECLLVRKRGTERFMLPGGKFEPGEDDRACLARELDEEVGLALPSSGTERLGRFAAAAANEPGHVVDATVYAWKPRTIPQPRLGAEIAETRWFAVRAGGPAALPLAPLVADHILPMLGQRSP